MAVRVSGISRVVSTGVVSTGVVSTAVVSTGVFGDDEYTVMSAVRPFYLRLLPRHRTAEYSIAK